MALPCRCVRGSTAAPLALVIWTAVILGCSGGGGSTGGSGGAAGSGGEGGTAGVAGSGGTAGDHGAQCAGGIYTGEFVESIEPDDAAVDVEPDAAVAFELSACIDPTSVTEDTFSLVSESGLPVVAPIAVEGARSTRSPEVPFALLETYDADVTAGVLDCEGCDISEEVSWTFTIRDGAWDAPELIETDENGATTNVRVAVDAAGNGVAVWSQGDGTRTNIWANRFEDGAWGTAQLIETDDQGDAIGVRVALGEDGDGVAVWAQWDGTRFSLWGSRFEAGAWASPVLIETDDTGNVFFPALALAPDGDGVVVWPQNDGDQTNIWSSRFVGGIWETRRLVESNDGFADSVDVSLSPSGDGFAVWLQSDGLRENVWASRLQSGVWGEPEMIEDEEPDSVSPPRIVADSQGRAVAVWSQLDGVRGDIWSNRYSGGWGTAEAIETLDGTAFDVEVDLDPSGDGFAVWVQQEEGVLSLFASRYSAGGDWSTPERIEEDDTGSAAVPYLCTGPLGNAMALWRQTVDGQARVWASRYVGGLWQEPLPISAEGASATDPHCAVDLSSRVTTAWHRLDEGPLDVAASRFD
ncbi:MAG: Ig-like domain-containing protein [Myxococcota bacterium]